MGAAAVPLGFSLPFATVHCLLLTFHLLFTAFLLTFHFPFTAVPLGFSLPFAAVHEPFTWFSLPFLTLHFPFTAFHCWEFTCRTLAFR